MIDLHNFSNSSFLLRKEQNKPPEIKTKEDLYFEKVNKLKDIKTRNKILKNINETISEINNFSHVLFNAGDLVDPKLGTVNKLEIKINLTKDSSTTPETYYISKNSDVIIDFSYLSCYLNDLKYIFTSLLDLIDSFKLIEYNTILNSLKFSNCIKIILPDFYTQQTPIKDQTSKFINSCKSLEEQNQLIINSLVNFESINNLKITLIDKLEIVKNELKAQILIYLRFIDSSVSILNTVKTNYNEIPKA